jgi:O-6-methylguanine DNA methyltransferase
MPKHVEYIVFQTALGPCGLAWTLADRASEPAIVSFALPERNANLTESRIAAARRSTAAKSSEPPAQIAGLIDRIIRHLQGDIQDFRDVQVDLEGVDETARLVYQAARAIPAGETKTYGEIAKAIGKPAAAQEVGQALGRNPVGLIIPCHRVLAAGGKLGGFSAPGGLDTKIKMLEIERAKGLTRKLAF